MSDRNQSTVPLKLPSVAFLILLIISTAGKPLCAQGIVQGEETGNRAVEQTIGKVLGNFIAIGTGQVADGEQIPVPAYRDGTRAKRDETYYFVSLNQITTSYGQATGYVTCSVDARGYAHASFWMRVGEQDLDAIGTKGEEALEKYYESISYGRRDLETIHNVAKAGIREQLASTLKELKEKVSINYLAIAIRSSKK